MNRKNFIIQGLTGLTAGALMPRPLMSCQDEEIFDADQITEFVFAAHSDFDKTKRIAEEYPRLLNCTNQFKKGDFETAVGGSSHMGRKDITDMLVQKGARLDIFNFAFLGYTDLVKQLVMDFPQLLRAPGPHGFTLLHHAKVGKHDELSKWLEDQGLVEEMFKGAFK